jgi:hypothetical protein
MMLYITPTWISDHERIRPDELEAPHITAIALVWWDSLIDLTRSGKNGGEGRAGERWLAQVAKAAPDVAQY